jgi:hypothetical protein
MDDETLSTLLLDASDQISETLMALQSKTIAPYLEEIERLNQEIATTQVLEIETLKTKLSINEMVIESLQAQLAEARAGEMPRRFDEWSEADGPAIWWDTEMTNGEIVEPPTWYGLPDEFEWDEITRRNLLWVPLPKLASSRPA